MLVPVLARLLDGIPCVIIAFSGGENSCTHNKAIIQYPVILGCLLQTGPLCKDYPDFTVYTYLNYTSLSSSPSLRLALFLKTIHYAFINISISTRSITKVLPKMLMGRGSHYEIPLIYDFQRGLKCTEEDAIGKSYFVNRI